jgi:hypothetical protein
MNMRCLALVALSLSLTAPAIRAAEVVPPANVRFAKETDETPDFQRHVVPLLGRLGCNGRACHGSFQGQGGFRLSLFGYDFAADHAALTESESPRVDLKQVEQSLILQKPTLALDHEGGERFTPGGWEHRLLAKWIAGGAAPRAESAATFQTLEVTPAEIIAQQPGEKMQLRVVAHWSDGTREDVTPLCRFQTNDESIAVVSDTGVVTALTSGETHIVAFYDNGVAPISVLLPYAPPGTIEDLPATTPLDRYVTAKLHKLGLALSPRCTDAEFLRRASLDVTGTLPLADEVREFLADASPDKRANKIEELLARPGYASWWATQICDWTGNAENNGPVGSEQGLRRQFAEQWFRWVERRVAEDVPYDQLVAGIVLAKSRTAEQDFAAYCAEMSSYFREADPADFAARETMPHFWSRRSLGADEEKARAFAYAFLGVRLECAQCHKHPFDQWTKDDFDEFAAFFSGVSYRPANRDQWNALRKEVGLGDLDEDSGNYKRQFVAMLAQGEVLPFKEVSVPAPSPGKRQRKPHPKLGRVITPRLLGGDEVLTEDYPDPRQPLMDWLRQKDNPYFARVLVNRVWGSYFGRGLVDPPDDMNLANPASNEPLLAYLAAQFVAHGYDLKWLHREILLSDAYQRSWQSADEGPANNARDERYHSRFALRRLPAEVLYDALVLATASDESAQKFVHDHEAVLARAIGLASNYSGARDERGYALQLFGKPAREANCDCERATEPNLQQTLYTQNDDAMLQLIERKDGWHQQVLAIELKDNAWQDVHRVIDTAYLRTLSRLPTDAERVAAAKYLTEGSSPAAALRDLLWALVNTKEFVVNH